MVYDFGQKLRFSFGVREQFDMKLLQNAIPGCVSVKKTDVAMDKAGIDYIATLRKGTEIFIDAKTREKGCSRFWRNGPELQLEIWSVCPSKNNKEKTGWTLKEDNPVDMILYTFDKSDCGEFFLLPFQHLRMAFIRNYNRWTERYKKARQPNYGYESEAVFVPADVVIEAITKEMCGIVAQKAG